MNEVKETLAPILLGISAAIVGALISDNIGASNRPFWSGATFGALVGLAVVHLFLTVAMGRRLDRIERRATFREAARVVANPEAMDFAENAGRFTSVGELSIASYSAGGGDVTISMTVPAGMDVERIGSRGWLPDDELRVWTIEVADPGFQPLGSFRFEADDRPVPSKRITVEIRRSNNGELVVDQQVSIPLNTPPAP